jgi:hypothetical protein
MSPAGVLTIHELSTSSVQVKVLKKNFKGYKRVLKDI